MTTPLLLGAGRGHHIIQFILALGAATALSSTDRAFGTMLLQVLPQFCVQQPGEGLSRGCPTSPSLFPVAVPTLCTVINFKI